MTIRVAINGFGRIGRMMLRAGLQHPELEFVAINNPGDPQMFAYLFKYDSIQRGFGGGVKAHEDTIEIDGKRIPLLAQRDPTKLPWKQLRVDLVLESTGAFVTKEDASQHLQAGARKVIISAPCKGPGGVKTIVKGVNEHILDKDDVIISIGSCTTNCLTPMVKVLNDNYGVERAYYTTIHAYTADQNLVDGSHKDFRRGRAAAQNIVPTSSGAEFAVVEVIPSLKNKIHGMALRVPVAAGSITDLTVELRKNVTKEQVNALLKNCSQYHLKGVLEYSEDPLVSSDIVGNPHSVIIDSALTLVEDGNLVKIVGWYDNEWGFSNRMVEIAKLFGGLR
ncbi:type I glyceraldehyde-3-phosphate dehydrogenase [Candidatus Woesearchaeota archaeon]|nr:type I glyceraldehyde-3-phosphate dehydrogenase [Candidatus Woesearchaeota archaeon]